MVLLKDARGKTGAELVTLTVLHVILFSLQLVPSRFQRGDGKGPQQFLITFTFICLKEYFGKDLAATYQSFFYILIKSIFKGSYGESRNTGCLVPVLIYQKKEEKSSNQEEKLLSNHAHVYRALALLLTRDPLLTTPCCQTCLQAFGSFFIQMLDHLRCAQSCSQLPGYSAALHVLRARPHPCCPVPLR